MRIKFTANSKGKPPDYEPLDHWRKFRKLADCELRFHGDEPLAGYKLQGFVIAEVIIGSDTLPEGGLHIFPPNYRRGRGRGNSIALLKSTSDDSYNYGEIKSDLANKILKSFKRWRQTNQ